MRALVLAVFPLLVACSQVRAREDRRADTPPVTDAVFAEPGGEPQPLMGIAVELDLSSSDLASWNVELVLGEINRIWARAGICFEFRDHRLGLGREGELRLSFLDADLAGLNGRYESDRDLWSLDQPDLYDAPHPTVHPASRTASHELGHALGLRHYNRRPDSTDSLMASGTRGFFLHDFEIAAARRAATNKVPSARPRSCRAPRLL
jgi:hypothetical protein